MADNRVLIVDDVQSVRQDLRTFLTLAGKIEIIGEASNGLDAIQLVRTFEPHMVLMDLEMPVMDGCAATHQIKAFQPSCRVIALTIHAKGAGCRGRCFCNQGCINGIADESNFQRAHVRADARRRKR